MELASTPSKKRDYEPPALKMHGSVADITRTGGNGSLEGSNPGAKKTVSTG